jgi:hypothetical protein
MPLFKRHLFYWLFSKRLLFLSLLNPQTVNKQIDWNVRCETPAGYAGQMRPHRSKATRRLIARPAENEHPGVEINDPCKIATKFTKTAFLFYILSMEIGY